MIKTITSNSLFKTIALGGILSLFSNQTNAQVSLTTIGSPYIQNFDGLANTGTGLTFAIPGWSIFETGTNANQLYSASTGSSNSGETYSFGAAASSDRALGSLASGSLLSSYGASFINNTGSYITDLGIEYQGEQWRSGDVLDVKDSLVFEYSTDATSLSTGTWIPVTSLNFKSPITTAAAGLLDGNLGANQSIVSGSITNLAIPIGATVWVRLKDVNITGSDDGLSVDNFVLVPSFMPRLNIMDVTVMEGATGTTAFNFYAYLSVPAGAGGVTFDITTTDNTALAPGDYVTNTLTTQTIPQGANTYTFVVLVNGDGTQELNEDFFVNVSNVSNALLEDGVGLGNIINDDIIPPSITMQPENFTACNGSMAMFLSQAFGDPTPTVQWQISTNGGALWTDIPFQTTDMLMFTATISENGNMYRSVYTNSEGADTSYEATLFVNPTYNLNVTDSVCNNASYQFPDGTIINNITSTVSHTSNLTTAMFGCDSIINTTINVNPIYNVSENAGVCMGGDYTYPDGTIHTNITADESYISNLQTLLGCDSIVTTNLTVNPYSQITANSGNVQACGDVAADFGIVATGNNNTYQWFYDLVGGSDFGLIDGTYTEINFDTDTMTIQQLLTGNYNNYYVYCEVTNEFGCMTRSDNDTIIANELPVVDFDYLSDGMITNVCADMNDTLALSGGFPLGGVYSGPMVFNDTLRAFTLYNTSGAGNYEFEYSYVDVVTGCSNTAIDTLFIDWCMGINDQDNLSMNVNLFPNPAHNKLSIEFATEVNSAKISLVNVIGQIVLTESINSRTSKVELNLSSIETGVYYLLILNGAERTVKKVIVE